MLNSNSKTSDVTVIKRDGRKVRYNSDNVSRAIFRAFKDEGYGYDLSTSASFRLTEKVENKLVRANQSEVKVEDIHTAVEDVLMTSSYKNVARSYIEFRSARDRDREDTTDINVSITRLMNKDKAIVNENANKDSKTFTTNRDLTAGVVAKVEGLKMLPKAVANAHRKGEIHYHDLDYQPYSPMTNCFSRDTEFVTSEGIKSFKDYEYGDRISVLTPDGNWKPAVVKSYGTQKLNAVTFKKGNSQPRVVKVTGNHRWILKNGLETTSLAVGDLLRDVAEPVRLSVEDILAKDLLYRINWVKGFIYGDGSTYASEGSRIRLCGDKIVYKPIFDSVEFRLVSTAEYLNGDVLMSSSKIGKTMLAESEPIEAKEAFISGWLEADGSFRNGNTDYKSLITIGKKEDIEMFSNLSATAKYHIVGSDDLTGERTNYGTRKATKSFRLAHGNYFTWKVVDIVENVEEDEVWCLEVEEEKAFTLSGGIPTGNCCLIDFEGMLADGFTIGNAEVESPKSIQTAMAQVSQIIANVASSQYGGCSFNRADEVLAKYADLNYNKHYNTSIRTTLALSPNDIDLASNLASIDAEIRTCKDIYDAMQAHEYEINTLFSSNGQTPFYTLNFGLGTGKWEREIQRAILEVRIKGLGKDGRTAIFPKLVMGMKKGVNVNPEDPNYDIKQLALECATKRMYPDIINYEKLVDITGSYKAPMGCRSFLQGLQDEQGNELTDGRMNLGVVTLNLPRIALEANGDMDYFWELFYQRLDILEEALVFRMSHVINNATPDMAPILYKYGAFGKRLNSSDSVKEMFEGLRATISMGYIGLYEVGASFYGGAWENNSEAKEFTLDILKEMKDRALSLSNKYGVWFSVYSTPAESLTDRFCKLDKEKYGSIENITDKDYYTNSFHYDVRKNPTPFEKIDFEKDYPQYCGGGFIHYCEYPVLTWNTQALEAVWDYSYDKIAYLGTNTPIDKCHECEFEGEFEPTELGYKCPQCDNSDPKTVDVVKRQCGYLGQPQARPNAYGRKKEIDARVKHIK